MNHTTAIRIIISALAVLSILFTGTSLPIIQERAYAEAQTWFAGHSNNIQSRQIGNLTPLLMPMGVLTTVCPAGTAFGVKTLAPLPPGYNTLPVGTTLCMRNLGHQTITTILPAGNTLIMQVIASLPNQSTCSAPSVLGLVSFGIPPAPATTSLCVMLL